jgi:hypothetical protein
MIAQITKPKLMVPKLTEPKLTEPKLTGLNLSEAKLAQPKETRVFRRIVPVIGFFAGFGVVLSAAPAWAQVNIDQGKSPAEMFSGDCATCHKSAKGLANGRNAGALTGFLREHYTSGPQQAAALAAYVLGAGSGPAPTANLKPGTAAGEAKSSDAKPGDKTRPGRPESSSTAKLQQPDQDTKIEAEPATEPAPAANGRKPAAGKHEPKSVTASRGQRPERETPPPTPEAAPITAPVATPETAPAPVATAPATSEPSNPAAPAEAQPAMPVTAAAPGAAPEASSAPAAAAPANSEASPSANAVEPGEAPSGEAPAESTPVPRDDIPD